MTTRYWIIGSGGMLGSAVFRQLMRTHPDHIVQAPRIDWGEQSALDDLEKGLNLLLSARSSDWQIIWCAGGAVTSSGADRLHAEFTLFSAFLDLLADKSKRTRVSGSIFFASSAGAAYGGSSRPPFTELSIPAPLGDYGVAKLRAEQRLEEFSQATGTPVLIGRIANLYGPGQSLTKRQGLITELCRSSLLGLPTSIYVSLDTRRDYLYVDDCAELLLKACQRLMTAQGNGQTVRKILASGRSVTIASLIGEFRQVAGRRPLIVMGNSANSSLQGRDLRLNSVVWADLDRVQKTPLVVGIARTLADLSSRLNVEGGRSFG